MGRVRLGPIVLFTLITQAVGIAVNALLTLIAHRTHGATEWIATTAIATIAALVVAVLDAMKDESGPTPDVPSPGPGPPHGGTGGYLPPPVRRGTPVLPALLVLLLVVGGGGFAVTEGVRYAVGYYSGNENGPDYLDEPRSVTAGALRLTVEHVYYTRHFTRVEADVGNDGPVTVSLPVFGNCQFIGRDGTTLAADPQRSRWSEAVPGGVPHHRGVLVFPGRLPAKVHTAKFSFAVSYGPSAGALTVTGIRLHPPSR